jgi:drug/metabolite transporter (DMT)-like permease
MHAWSGTTILSMITLVVAGSWLGFTCYAYALTALPAPVVSTYAYVNPVVAVALGWLLLGERLSWATAGGAALIIVSVAATVVLRARQAPPTLPADHPPALTTATQETS